MGVVFEPGQTLGQGDLDIFLTDAGDAPSNPYSITYSIYFVDPDPPHAEVLIGTAGRIPENPTVGEFYAALLVPGGATPGDYRIRWRFQQYASSPEQEVVQEWAVRERGQVALTTLSPNVKLMVDKLRILLRDNCIGGEETVELDVGGERMLVSMEELYEECGDLDPSEP